MNRSTRIRLILALVACAFTASPALAEPEPAARRGLITSAPCPYTCADAKLSSDVCREHRSGDTCQVEDLTQAPGHRSLLRVPATLAAAAPSAAADAGRRGLVTSASCPYGCKEAGLSPEICREHRSGDTCQVEDLSQAPGHRTLIRTN